MSGSWVAAVVRARSLARQRLGRAGTRELSRCASLDSAVELLGRGIHAHAGGPGDALGVVRRAVATELLWDLRVLGGWLPPRGLVALRALAGWFEVANVDEVIGRLLAASAVDPRFPPPFRLGALSTARPRGAPPSSLAALRSDLTAGPWGDPGGDSPWELQLGVRTAWAERVARDVPGAADWAAGWAALLVARELVVAGRRPPPPTAARIVRLLGPRAQRAADLHGFVAALPRSARWALSGVDAPEHLWRAEPRFWNRVEEDAFGLLGRAGFGSAQFVGAVALLAVDAWRVHVALALAEAGGAEQEVVDALL